MRDLGLLVMSYGTARGPDDVEAYYTHVRRGKPPTPELLAELKSRYEAIGGSPLIDITEAQVRGLERALGDGGDVRYRAFLGMKHQHPYIEDAVAAMAAEGLTSGVGLVLAPHYSRFSVGEYVERATKATEAPGIKLSFIESFADHPAFVRLLAERVSDVRALLPEEKRDAAPVIFSAHSLPARIVEAGDPYPQQLQDTADAVAKELGLERYMTAWQSAGRTGEEWLGPDLCDVLRTLGAQGVPAAVVCPAGFVADHLEVLYDIDIEAQAAAREVGMTLVRTESPNADPKFLEVLAGVVRDHVSREGL